MTLNAAGTYLAVMPGADAGNVIQFYVEATDRRGATAWFPAQGPDSRALVPVARQATEAGQLHRVQLVMTRTDRQLLHLPTNSLSNERLGATVIYDDQVFYDAGVRLKGSFVGRNAVRRVSTSCSVRNRSSAVCMKRSRWIAPRMRSWGWTKSC